MEVVEVFGAEKLGQILPYQCLKVLVPTCSLGKVDCVFKNQKKRLIPLVLVMLSSRGT